METLHLHKNAKHDPVHLLVILIPLIIFMLVFLLALKVQESGDNFPGFSSSQGNLGK